MHDHRPDVQRTSQQFLAFLQPTFTVKCRWRTSASLLFVMSFLSGWTINKSASAPHNAVWLFGLTCVECKRALGRRPELWFSPPPPSSCSKVVPPPLLSLAVLLLLRLCPLSVSCVCYFFVLERRLVFLGYGCWEMQCNVQAATVHTAWLGLLRDVPVDEATTTLSSPGQACCTMSIDNAFTQQSPSCSVLLINCLAACVAAPAMM